jgi:hypothetical protein
VLLLLIARAARDTAGRHLRFSPWRVFPALALGQLAAQGLTPPELEAILVDGEQGAVGAPPAWPGLARLAHLPAGCKGIGGWEVSYGLLLGAKRGWGGVARGGPQSLGLAAAHGPCAAAQWVGGGLKGGRCAPFLVRLPLV